MRENKTYDFSAVDNYVEQLSSREAEDTATIRARNFRIKAPGYLYAGLGIGLAILLICLGISFLLRNWDDAERIESGQFFYPWFLPYKSEMINESYINGNIGRPNIRRDSIFSDYNFPQPYSLLPETSFNKRFSQSRDFNLRYSTEPNTLFFGESDGGFTSGSTYLSDTFSEGDSLFFPPGSISSEVCTTNDSGINEFINSQSDVLSSKEDPEIVRNYVLFDHISLPYSLIDQVSIGRQYLDPKSSPDLQWCYVERNNHGDLVQHLSLARKLEETVIKATLNESIAQEFGVPLEHLLYAQTECNFI